MGAHHHHLARQPRPFFNTCNRSFCACGKGVALTNRACFLPCDLEVGETWEQRTRGSRLFPPTLLLVCSSQLSRCLQGGRCCAIRAPRSTLFPAAAPSSSAPLLHLTTTIPF